MLHINDKPCTYAITTVINNKLVSSIKIHYENIMRK